MFGDKVHAKCRKCGDLADAELFKMDYDAKVMVCPLCFKKKDAPIIAKSPPAVDSNENDEKKPEEVPISELTELNNALVYENIPDSDKIKFNCQRCGYPIKYNLITQTPALCPYCGEEVPEMD